MLAFEAAYDASDQVYSAWRAASSVAIDGPWRDIAAQLRALELTTRAARAAVDAAETSARRALDLTKGAGALEHAKTT